MRLLLSTLASGWAAGLRRRSTATSRRGVTRGAADLAEREERLVLVDGNAILHQSFHAMATGNLRNSAGEPTGAVYAFLRDLRVVQRVWKPSHFAVLMDHEYNKRKEIFSQYKEHREPCPEDLVGQLRKAKEACAAFQWGCEDSAGYEADDLIATHARKASEKDRSVIIISSDKDMLQLIGPKVSMCRTSHLEPRDQLQTIDQPWVKKHWGVEPGQMVDLLALVGDTSDGIPGVPGIGRVKAAALLNRYGSLNGVLEAARRRLGKKLDVPGVGLKLTANIRECEQQVLVMRTLIELQQVPDVKNFNKDFKVPNQTKEWFMGVARFLEKEDMQWLKAQVRKDVERECE